jgi:hypothetical protein
MVWEKKKYYYLITNMKKPNLKKISYERAISRPIKVRMTPKMLEKIGTGQVCCVCMKKDERPMVGFRGSMGCVAHKECLINSKK